MWGAAGGGGLGLEPSEVNQRTDRVQVAMLRVMVEGEVLVGAGLTRVSRKGLPGCKRRDKGPRGSCRAGEGGGPPHPTLGLCWPACPRNFCSELDGGPAFGV